jgi:hypothetical protein
MTDSVLTFALLFRRPSVYKRFGVREYLIVHPVDEGVATPF